MIDKLYVHEIVQDALMGSSKFLVNLKISVDNRIFVDIDGDDGINIDDCIEISRLIESKLNRDEEDFELNVSSAGADSPLRLPRQYRRHVGRTLSVVLNDGRTFEGVLTDADDTQATFRTKGTKKVAPETITVAYSDIVKACVVIKF